MKERFKLIPAVYLILIKEGKILLLRRYNTGYEDGQYSLVAGHAEGGVAMTQEMIREAKEEADITIRPEDLRMVHLMHREGAKSNERVDIFFQALKWSGEIKNLEPQKCDDLSWFAIESIPANTIPYVKLAIDNIRQGIFYSEFGR